MSNLLELDKFVISKSNYSTENKTTICHILENYRYHKKDIQEWCNHLRSGEYKQIKEQIKTKNGFCCLGVLVDFTKCTRKEIRLESVGIPQVWHIKKNHPIWPSRVNNDFLHLTGISLVSLNDKYDATFDDIADLIEAVFIHEVLL